MPNWIRNKVHFEGDKEALSLFQAFMKSDDNLFDFNKLIPMPESLKMEEGSVSDTAVKAAKAKRAGETSLPYEIASSRTFDEWAKLGEEYLKNEEIYGFRTWYGWCNHNWGTKWNACDVIWDEPEDLVFDTAWSTPLPVFKALAAKFPKLEFTVRFADEDIGSNCGRIENIGSSLGVSYDEGIEFACDVWDLDPSEVIDDEPSS